MNPLHKALEQYRNKERSLPSYADLVQIAYNIDAEIAELQVAAAKHLTINLPVVQPGQRLHVASEGQVSVVALGDTDVVDAALGAETDVGNAELDSCSVHVGAPARVTVRCNGVVVATQTVMPGMDNFVDLPNIEPAPEAIPDHEICKLVNELRDIAYNYHDTQQLRARIANVIVPAVKVANVRKRFAKDNPDASMSWNGFNLYGDKKSIVEVDRLMRVEQESEALKDESAALEDELGKMKKYATELEGQSARREEERAAAQRRADADILRLRKVLLLLPAEDLNDIGITAGVNAMDTDDRMRNYADRAKSMTAKTRISVKEFDDIVKENDFVKGVLSKFGYGGPLTPAACPLEEMLTAVDIDEIVHLARQYEPGQIVPPFKYSYTNAQIIEKVGGVDLSQNPPKIINGYGQKAEAWKITRAKQGGITFVTTDDDIVNDAIRNGDVVSSLGKARTWSFIGWSYELATAMKLGTDEYCNFERRFSTSKPNSPEGSIRNLKAAYA